MSRLAGPALVPMVGTVLLLAGCGSTATGVRAATSPAPTGSGYVVARVACGPGRVSVPVGGRVALSGCAAGVTATATDTRLVEVTATSFEAVRAGAAGITLVERPVCAPGTPCPQYLRLLGTISVTVGPAGS